MLVAVVLDGAEVGRVDDPADGVHGEVARDGIDVDVGVALGDLVVDSLEN